MEDVTSDLIHGAYKCLRTFCLGDIEKIWQFRELKNENLNYLESGLVYISTFTSFRCGN